MSDSAEPEDTQTFHKILEFTPQSGGIKCKCGWSIHLQDGELRAMTGRYCADYLLDLYSLHKRSRK